MKKLLSALVVLILLAGCASQHNISNAFSKRKYLKGYFDNFPGEKPIVTVKHETVGTKEAALPKTVTQHLEPKKEVYLIPSTSNDLVVLQQEENKTYFPGRKLTGAISDIVRDSGKIAAKTDTDPSVTKGRNLMMGSAIASLCTFIFPPAILAAFILAIMGIGLIPKTTQPKSKIGRVALVFELISFAVAILAGIVLLPGFPVIFSIYSLFMGIGALGFSVVSLILSIISLYKEGDGGKAAAVAILLFPCEVLLALIVLFCVDSKII